MYMGPGTALQLSTAECKVCFHIEAGEIQSLVQLCHATAMQAREAMGKQGDEETEDGGCESTAGSMEQNFVTEQWASYTLHSIPAL